MAGRTIIDIQDVFSIEGSGEVAVVILKGGVLRLGMKAILNGKEAEVVSIESGGKVLDSFSTIGGKAGVLLRGVNKSDITLGGIIFT